MTLAGDDDASPGLLRADAIFHVIGSDEKACVGQADPPDQVAMNQDAEERQHPYLGLCWDVVDLVGSDRRLSQQRHLPGRFVTVDGQRAVDVAGIQSYSHQFGQSLWM